MMTKKRKPGRPFSHGPMIEALENNRIYSAALIVREWMEAGNDITPGRVPIIRRNLNAMAERHLGDPEGFVKIQGQPNIGGWSGRTWKRLLD